MAIINTTKIVREFGSKISMSVKSQDSSGLRDDVPGVFIEMAWENQVHNAGLTEKDIDDLITVLEFYKATYYTKKKDE